MTEDFRGRQVPISAAMEGISREIPLGRKSCYGTLKIDDLSAFPENVQWHIYEYGLRQILNDAIAAKNDDDGVFLGKEKLVEKAQKRLDNLLAGNIRAASNSPVLDGKTQIVFNLLREALLTKWRAAGVFGPFPKGTKNRFLFVANKIRAQKGEPAFETDNEYLESVLEQNPKTRERFEARADQILAEREEDLGIEI